MPEAKVAPSYCAYFIVLYREHTPYHMHHRPVQYADELGHVRGLAQWLRHRRRVGHGMLIICCAKALGPCGVLLDLG